MRYNYRNHLFSAVLAAASAVGATSYAARNSGHSNSPNPPRADTAPSGNITSGRGAAAQVAVAAARLAESHCPPEYSITNATHDSVDTQYAYNCVDATTAQACKISNGKISKPFQVDSGHPLEEICSALHPAVAVEKGTLDIADTPPAPVPAEVVAQIFRPVPPQGSESATPASGPASPAYVAPVTPSPAPAVVAAQATPVATAPAVPEAIAIPAAAPVATKPAANPNQARIDMLTTDLEGITKIIKTRTEGYNSLVKDLTALGTENAETLAVLREGLASDLRYVRGLRTDADLRCGQVADLYMATITLLASQTPTLTTDKELLTAAVQCRDTSARYDAAEQELVARVKRNLTRKGQFALEASVGYFRYGFNQGGDKPNGANLGTAGAAACYDLPGITEVCADGKFIFAGRARATSPVKEGPSTSLVDAGYQNKTSVAGTRVTETDPQYAAGLRAMSPDLATHSAALDVRVGVAVEGIVGEESVQTDRTRTSQLQAADGTALGAPHVVSDSDHQTINYVDLVPQGVVRVGTSHVYGQLNAGYSTRQHDAVIGAGAGVKLDF